MPDRTEANRPNADRREIRVFISSTFRDMQEEREELVKQIFPQLRRLCESRGVTWGEVDLRWGVPDEAKAEGKVLPLCLAEIKKCKPYFIGLLGERYGWVPEISAELLEEQPWLAEDRTRSVTALEILHGVLREPEMAEHAFFYFRDPSYAEAHEGFTEQDLVSREKLAKLKDDIRESRFPVAEPFSTPKQLGEWVLRDLTAVIEKLYPETEIPNALDRAAFDHEAYSASRRTVYIGREEYMDRLDDHAAGDRSPLVVLGESGGGKSALLANWTHHWSEQHPETPVLVHFIGASPDSANWMAMLRRLLGEFQRKFGIQTEIPDQPEALRMAFANALHMIAARGRLVLALDALNQIEDRDGAPDLIWLPPVIPSNVRLVVSTLPGRPLDDLKKRDWPVLNVEPLTVPERRKLIDDYLARYAKHLDKQRSLRIAATPQTGSGLYLSTLLNELRQFGHHGELDKRIDWYLEATDPVELYSKVLQRWEQDYEEDGTGRENIVGKSLSNLWAARRGLSETELLESLGTLGAPLPRAIWSPLYLAAGDALVSHGGLLTFAHVFLREATEKRYITSPDRRRDAHNRLAQYFGSQETGHRMLEELPWQLTRAGEWAALKSLITNPSFMEALHGFNSTEFAGYTLNLLNRTGIDAASLYQDFLFEPRSFNVQTLTIVDTLLQLTGLLDQAATLSAQIARIAESGGDPAAFGKALLVEISCRKAKGDYNYDASLEKAERIFRNAGARESLARCLAHRADFHKYHRRDLLAGIACHQKQERLLHKIGNMHSLVTCLNNQATTYGKLQQPEKQFALRLESERIARASNDIDLIALAEANLGMFYLQSSLIQRGALTTKITGSDLGPEQPTSAEQFMLRFGFLPDNLRKGWMFLKSAEWSYRALGKPASLARVLRHQVETIVTMIESPFLVATAEVADVVVRLGIPRAQEARKLYLQFGNYRRSEVSFLDILVEQMTMYLGDAQSSSLDLGEIIQAIGIGSNAQTLAERAINRGFAQFILREEREMVSMMP